MKGLEELLCEHENSGCRETINLPTKPTRRRVLMCLLPAKVFMFPLRNHTNSLGTKKQHHSAFRPANIGLYMPLCFTGGDTMTRLFTFSFIKYRLHIVNVSANKSSMSGLCPMPSITFMLCS